MVDQGARGQTAAQIEKLLGASSAGELAASSRALLAHLAAVTSTTGDGSKQPRFTDANGLWLQKSLKVEARFLSTLGTEFGAAPGQGDFQTAPDAARNTINGWVAQHTEGHITDLFPRGSITNQTLLVLANAVYLKAQWQNQFEAALTAPAPFREPSGSQVPAKFMTMQPVALPYARSASYQAVEFPYLGSSLSLLVLMPTRESVARLMDSLTPARFGAITNRLKSERVRVYLPRLDLNFQSQLNDQLSALGMPDAFSDNADLTKISAGPPRLSIQTVQHAATFQVTETGTVASAATGIGGGAAAPVAAPIVKFDHPFLLFLSDNTTRAVLFAAVVVNPLAG